MAKNELLPFADGEDANVLPTAQWEALTDILENGFQSGIARSEQVNRVLAQGAVASYVLGQLIVDQLSKDATLDKDTLYQNLISALQENAKDACLPLSGGTLTGALRVVNYLYVSANGENEGGEIQLDPPTGYTDYGSINIDYWKNVFRIFNDRGNSLFKLEQDTGIGYMFDQKVERIHSSDSGYIRYESGLQICWGAIGNGSWTFPQAFVSAPTVIVTPRGDGAYHGTRVSSTNNTSCAVANGGGWGMNAIAIGHWK